MIVSILDESYIFDNLFFFSSNSLRLINQTLGNFLTGLLFSLSWHHILNVIFSLVQKVGHALDCFSEVHLALFVVVKI